MAITTVHRYTDPSVQGTGNYWGGHIGGASVPEGWDSWEDCLANETFGTITLSSLPAYAAATEVSFTGNLYNGLCGRISVMVNSGDPVYHLYCYLSGVDTEYNTVVINWLTYPTDYDWLSFVGGSVTGQSWGGLHDISAAFHINTLVPILDDADQELRTVSNNMLEKIHVRHGEYEVVEQDSGVVSNKQYIGYDINKQKARIDIVSGKSTCPVIYLGNKQDILTGSGCDAQWTYGSNFAIDTLHLIANSSYYCPLAPYVTAERIYLSYIMENLGPANTGTQDPFSDKAKLGTIWIKSNGRISTTHDFAEFRADIAVTVITDSTLDAVPICDKHIEWTNDIGIHFNFGSSDDIGFYRKEFIGVYNANAVDGYAGSYGFFVTGFDSDAFARIDDCILVDFDSIVYSPVGSLGNGYKPINIGRLVLQGMEFDGEYIEYDELIIIPEGEKIFKDRDNGDFTVIHPLLLQKGIGMNKMPESIIRLGDK